MGQKLGIFGGTFDPPHRGHTAAASAAIKELELDRLLVVPANSPPHKQTGGEALPAKERLRLTELAMKKLAKARVSDIEISRGGVSYTVDTVRELSKREPGAKLFLIVGADQLASMSEWKDAREILSAVTVAAVKRRDSDARLIRDAADALRRDFGARVRILDNAVVEISSTDLRALLPLRRGREYLEPDVYAEVIKHRYFGAKPEYEWLREQAYSMLTPQRVAHVKGCEQTAAELARRYGADEEKAREAAILHDITKKEGLREQLKLCEKYGIEPDTMESVEGKLLHSKTGAAIAKYEFGCDDDVFGAIYWHTTGKEDMSLLEKIMYMADYIEPNRTFEGVEEMRKAAFEDLDRALHMGFRASVEDMQGRGVQLHARTIGALRYIEKQLKVR